MCDWCGVSCRSGKRIFRAFKTVLGAKRSSVGSAFDGKLNVVGSCGKSCLFVGILIVCVREMSRRNSRDGGWPGEEFLVECGRCKQWISGDRLGLDREKIKKDQFYV